jgi:hypothetical protein
VPIQVRFRGGLIRLVANKSSDKKANATGSGGGFRSSHWITALIQFYFCIGISGDILPNYKGYALNGVALGNVTAKVFNSIYSILNLYFQLKKSSFTISEIKQLESSTQTVNAHLTLLWELKQAVLQAPVHKRMRLHKNHSLVHFPEQIRLHGALSKSSCDRYEGAHPEFTTKNYKRVSKRKDTLLSEMTSRIVVAERRSHLKHVEGIITEKTDYLKTISPKILGGDETIFTRVQGGAVAHFRLEIDPESSLFRIAIRDSDEMRCIHPALATLDVLTQKVKECIKSFRSDMWDLIIANILEVELLGGIKFVGSDSSKIGVGTIYATHSFRPDRYHSPRYDFVEVFTDQGNVFAQVAAFIQISDPTGQCSYFNNIECPEIIAIVIYLRKERKEQKKRDKNGAPKITSSTNHHFFDRYEWEWYYSNKSYSKHYNITAIDIKSIVGPAYVVRDFCQHSNPHCGLISFGDRFTYIPRKFSDRSGWEEEDFDKIMSIYGIVVESPEQIAKYLQEQQTSYGGLVHMAETTVSRTDAKGSRGEYDIAVNSRDVMQFEYSDDEYDDDYDFDVVEYYDEDGA